MPIENLDLVTKGNDILLGPVGHHLYKATPLILGEGADLPNTQKQTLRVKLRNMHSKFKNNTKLQKKTLVELR